MLTEHLRNAKEAAEPVAGVSGATVRARWMGRSLAIDIEAGLDPATALSDADGIGAPVIDAVYNAVEEARIVHWSAHAASPPDAAS